MVGVVADLQGASGSRDDTLKLHLIDSEVFDDRMRRLRPAVVVAGARLEFESLADFDPLPLARRHPATRDLLSMRTLLAEWHGRLQAHPDLLEALAEAVDSPDAGPEPLVSWWAHDASPELARERLRSLQLQARSGRLAHPAGLAQGLRARVHALDEERTARVTEVLHDPGFKRLEAS